MVSNKTIQPQQYASVCAHLENKPDISHGLGLVTEHAIKVNQIRMVAKISKYLVLFLYVDFILVRISLDLDSDSFPGSLRVRGFEHLSKYSGAEFAF